VFYHPGRIDIPVIQSAATFAGQRSSEALRLRSSRRESDRAKLRPNSGGCSVLGQIRILAPRSIYAILMRQRFFPPGRKMPQNLHSTDHQIRETCRIPQPRQGIKPVSAEMASLALLAGQEGKSD
jgi:hypothetical protein